VAWIERVPVSILRFLFFDCTLLATLVQCYSNCGPRLG